MSLTSRVTLAPAIALLSIWCAASAAAREPAGLDRLVTKPHDAGYSVLYAFYGPPGDGYYPQAGVYVDKDLHVFGTTSFGGNVSGGTVFELGESGSGYAETFSYSLSCSIVGCEPFSPPIEDRNGNVFVENPYSDINANGSGTVMEFSPYGSTFEVNRLLVLQQSVGSSPNGPLLAIGTTFYTTTASGGPSGNGTIISLSHGLKPTLLFTFGVPSTTGQNPESNLAVDSSGAFYGITQSGGSENSGTVFKYVPGASGGQESILWNFQSGGGTQPTGGLILDGAGNLYGTTRNSGRYNGGTVFKLTPGSGGYVETVLHAFSSGADGSNASGGLVLKGNDLYGMTTYGGTGNCSDGCGTIYRIGLDGSHYGVVHTFQGLDGAFPLGALFSRDGALYGTTSRGPAYGNGQLGFGLVFKLVP